MISKKITKYLKQKEYFLEKEEESYRRALSDFGLDLDTEIAHFNLHTTEISFKGRNKGFINNICWQLIYSTYDKLTLALQENLGLPKTLIPLDNFEAEGGYFYNTETKEVIELEIGEKLINFQNGIIDIKWNSFNEFLEWFFELDNGTD